MKESAKRLVVQAGRSTMSPRWPFAGSAAQIGIRRWMNRPVVESDKDMETVDFLRVVSRGENDRIDQKMLVT